MKISDENITIANKWTNHFDSIRKKYIYVRNVYLTKFCWWYSINDKTKIKRCLNSVNNEIEDKDPEQFTKYEISKFSYIDKLWSLWPEFKDEAVIFVKNKYINKPKVTIDIEEIQNELKDDQKEGIESTHFTKIHAYSFGPFSINNFVKKDNKILWILREPLITIVR